MAESSLNLATEKKVENQETEQTVNSVNQRNLGQRHIMIKLLKTKDQEETLKVVREK